MERLILRGATIFRRTPAAQATVASSCRSRRRTTRGSNFSAITRLVHRRLKVTHNGETWDVERRNFPR